MLTPDLIETTEGYTLTRLGSISKTIYNAGGYTLRLPGDTRASGVAVAGPTVCGGN